VHAAAAGINAYFAYTVVGYLGTGKVCRPATHARHVTQQLRLQLRLSTVVLAYAHATVEYGAAEADWGSIQLCYVPPGKQRRL
jgi:hypothetical protein